MNHSLATLPSDVLSTIFDFLDDDAIYLLWKVGSSELQSKIRYAVRAFKVGEWPGSTRAAWPPVVLNNFVHCRSLEISFADLQELRPSLHLPLADFSHFPLATLIIAVPTFSAICHLFSSDIYGVVDASNHSGAVLLKDIFPRLHTLEISTLRIIKPLGALWFSLPPSLTDLKIVGPTFETIPAFTELLPSLTRLYAKFERRNEFSSLPVDLVSWNTHFVEPDFYRDENSDVQPYSDEELWKLIPSRALQDLRIVAENSDQMGPLVATFPRLDSLYMGCASSFSRVADCLPTSLTYLCCSSLENIDVLATLTPLPHSLTELDLHWRHYDYDYDAFKENIGQIFKALPRTLKRLILPREDLSHDVFWTDDELGALPPFLETTNVLRMKRWTEAQFVDRYVPKLRNFEYPPLCSHLILHLPSTLTKFTATNIGVPLSELRVLRTLGDQLVDVELVSGRDRAFSFAIVQPHLFLPRSVAHLSIRVSPTAWVPPHGKNLLEKEKSGDLPFAEHFHVLRKLTWELPESTPECVTHLPEAFPASLHWLKAAGGRTKRRLEFWKMIQPEKCPALETLTLCAPDLRGAEFALMPANLIYLSIYREGNSIGQCMYHPHDLAQLPPRLQSVSLLASYLPIPDCSSRATTPTLISESSFDEDAVDLGKVYAHDFFPPFLRDLDIDFPSGTNPLFCTFKVLLEMWQNVLNERRTRRILKCKAILGPA